MDSTDHVLMLVRRALDEFDDYPLQVSARRAVRIASLIGDSQAAVRLGFELQTSEGDPAQHRDDLRRLMADSARWGIAGDDASPDVAAMRAYLRDRQKPDAPGMVMPQSLAEIEYLTHDRPAPTASASVIEVDMMIRRIEERARLRTFSYLVAWERRLGYTSVNESIFGGYKVQVDKILAEGVPELVEQFTAVYRRMNEAAARDPQEPAGEELSQALTSCRRILESVVDHVLPARKEPSESGHRLDQAVYRNRLFEFIKEAKSSKSVASMTTALAAGLHERYSAVSELTNKGVHASIALEAANLCALNTYILCGEILLLQQHVDQAGINGPGAKEPSTAVEIPSQ